MNSRIGILLLAAALSVAVPPTRGGDTSSSESFSFATYKEKDGPITILVGSFPASLNEGEAFFPLQVAVGVRGRDATLTVTRESFTLIDPDGKVYPMATYREIRARDRLLEFNQSIDTAQPLVIGQQFANSFRIASRFFPSPASTSSPVDRVHLKRTVYFKDLIYFPYPDLGLRGVLTIRFRTKEMTRPIDVRFEVPLKTSD